MASGLSTQASGCVPSGTFLSVGCTIPTVFSTNACVVAETFLSFGCIPATIVTVSAFALATEDSDPILTEAGLELETEH